MAVINCSPVFLDFKRCVSSHIGQDPTVLRKQFWLLLRSLVASVSLALISSISRNPWVQTSLLQVFLFQVRALSLRL